MQDVGEACDNGADNADGEDSACSTKCLTPNCGNGKKDPEEECDDGAGNSDTEPGRVEPAVRMLAAVMVSPIRKRPATMAKRTAIRLPTRAARIVPRQRVVT